MSRQTDYKLAALAPVADATAVLVGILFLPQLWQWFQTTRGIGVALILGVFILFCAAVYVVRKLEAEPATAVALPDWLYSRPLMASLAILFGLGLSILLLGMLGYWQAIFEVNDRVLGAGESSAFFVYAPSSFIGFCFFYILVLSGETRPTILLGSGRYVPLALFGLLVINGMMLLLTAVVRSFELGQGWLVLALLLLFAPPRLWYVRKRPSYLPILSFLLLLIALVVTAG